MLHSSGAATCGRRRQKGGSWAARGRLLAALGGSWAALGGGSGWLLGGSWVTLGGSWAALKPEGRNTSKNHEFLKGFGTETSAILGLSWDCLGRLELVWGVSGPV